MARPRHPHPSLPLKGEGIEGRGQSARQLAAYGLWRAPDNSEVRNQIPECRNAKERDRGIECSDLASLAVSLRLRGIAGAAHGADESDLHHSPEPAFRPICFWRKALGV